jgi:hypothetical protein
MPFELLVQCVPNRRRIAPPGIKRVLWRSLSARRRPVRRTVVSGTSGSNPLPSSGESRANLPTGVVIRGPQPLYCSMVRPSLTSVTYIIPSGAT